MFQCHTDQFRLVGEIKSNKIAIIMCFSKQSRMFTYDQWYVLVSLREAQTVKTALLLLSNIAKPKSLLTRNLASPFSHFNNEPVIIFIQIECFLRHELIVIT